MHTTVTYLRARPAFTMAYNGAYNVCNIPLSVRVSGASFSTYYKRYEDESKMPPPFSLPKCIPANAAAELEQLYAAVKDAFR